MLNTIQVMGRLTADPELRHTSNSVAVTTFRIAVNRDYKDKTTGEKGVDFLPVVCWRNTAEFASRYLAKGQLVVVSGRLQVREYTDREGQKRNITEIIAENLYFGENRQREQNKEQYEVVNEFEDVDEDDIPF